MNITTYLDHPNAKWFMNIPITLLRLLPQHLPQLKTSVHQKDPKPFLSSLRGAHQSFQTFYEVQEEVQEAIAYNFLLIYGCKRNYRRSKKIDIVQCFVNLR